MAEYLPLISVAAFLLAVLTMLCLPWLRDGETREKTVVGLFVGWCLALALYLHTGAPFLLQDIERQRQGHAVTGEAIAGTRERLLAQPEDAALWAQLGALYIGQERYAEASAALKEAVKFSDGQPQLILMYGKAQMLAAEGQITAGARQAFEIAAQLMPDHPEPKFLLALERMQAGDREGARERLKALLPLLPEGAPLRARIGQLMKE